MAIRKLPASWKGVSFLWKRASFNEGQKTAVHEYPNSNRRFVETLGRLPETITMTGITKGIGEDYKTRRDALRRVLSEGGQGILVHPLHGSLTCEALVYDFDESESRTGVCTFSMTFKVIQAQVFPKTTGNRRTLLNNALIDTIVAIGEDIADNYSLVTGAAKTVQGAFDKAQDIADAFANDIQSVTEPISAFQQDLRRFQDNIGRIILAPDLLAQSITSLITNFQSLGSSPEGQFSRNTSFWTFGDDDDVLDFSTGARQELLNNNEILNQAMQGGFLAYNYGLVGTLNLSSEQVLEETRDLLENQYDKLADTLNVQVLEGIETCRFLAAEIFSQAEANVFRVIDINVNPIPMGVLAYRYYGSTENEADLIDLNQIIDSSRVEGDIQVFGK